MHILSPRPAEGYSKEELEKNSGRATSNVDNLKKHINETQAWADKCRDLISSSGQTDPVIVGYVESHHSIATAFAAKELAKQQETLNTLLLERKSQGVKQAVKAEEKRVETLDSEMWRSGGAAMDGNASVHKASESDSCQWNGSPCRNSKECCSRYCKFELEEGPGGMPYYAGYCR